MSSGECLVDARLAAAESSLLHVHEALRAILVRMEENEKAASERAEHVHKRVSNVHDRVSALEHPQVPTHVSRVTQPPHIWRTSPKRGDVVGWFADGPEERVVATCVGFNKDGAVWSCGMCRVYPHTSIPQHAVLLATHDTWVAAR